MPEPKFSSPLNSPIEIRPIGILKTPFLEKFGVPRQSGLISEARGILKLNPDANFRDGLRGLENFSHVWLIFQFHHHADTAWRALTTPPRVGAPKRVGVFASRSPHRPNGLGMSAVKLDSIDHESPGGIEIHLSGIDVLNETPVFDLKPYVPYVDCIPQAMGAWTSTEIPRYGVSFASAADDKISKFQLGNFRIDVRQLIIQMLEIDPRPTPQKKNFPIGDPKFEDMEFAFRIGAIDVHWKIKSSAILVVDILQV